MLQKQHHHGSTLLAEKRFGSMDKGWGLSFPQGEKSNNAED